MYLDTSDMSCEAANAHRRLCDFTWFNDGPPLNQDKSLKQITLTEEAEWPAVKRDLLRKGWLKVGDYLLHRGVIKTLNASKLKYIETFNRQAKMNKAVPLELSPPDAVTGVVTIIVTQTVTPAVTRMQSESQSQSESEKKVYSLSKKGSLGDSQGGDEAATGRTPAAGAAKHPTTNIQHPTSSGEPPRANGEQPEIRNLKPAIPMLTESGMGGVVARIMGNKNAWAYDNCKVQVRDFTAKQLTTVLREGGLGRVTQHRALTCWLEAAEETHRAAVDGAEMCREPAAYCIGAWKRRMGEAANSKSQNSNPKPDSPNEAEQS